MLRMEAKCFSSVHHTRPSDTLLTYNLSESDKLREIMDIQASVPSCPPLGAKKPAKLIDRPSSM